MTDAPERIASLRKWNNQNTGSRAEKTLQLNRCLDKIEALTAEIKRCRERLEIDHKYRMKLMCYAVIIGWTLYIYNTDVFQAYVHGLLGL